MTGEDLIFRLWENCRRTARYAGSVNAEAVQSLITQTRELLKFYGASPSQIDSVLFDLYIRAHWDWTEPSGRIFESLLDMELTTYFAERFDQQCNPS